MFDKKKYKKKYRKKNIEKIKEYMKNYRKKNTDRLRMFRRENTKKIKEYNREYYLRNADRLKVLRQNNMEKRKEYIKLYKQTSQGRLSIKVDRHNRRLSTKDLSLAIIQQVYENNIKRFGTLTCCLCNKSIEFGQDSLEHLQPISKGGINNIDNLGIAHKTCNNSKGKKTLEEYKLLQQV